MAKTFEASKNILPGNPGIRAELKDLAREVMGKNKTEADLKAVQLKEYTDKIQSLLQTAKTISDAKPKLMYGHPYVCDTFVKKIFNEIGDHSLDGVSQSYGIYNKYKNSLNGNLTPAARNTFAIKGKTPEAGDLLFFLNPKGVCPHVGILSSYTANELYIYDASLAGVGYRKVSPSELRGNYGYTSISFAPPFVS